MNNDAEIFRERLRQAREENNLTQAELGEKTGLPPSSISHFEKGPRKPSFDNLRRLAAALHVTTDYLLGRTNSTEEHVQVKILLRKAANLDNTQLKIVNDMIDALTKAKQ
jgi:transcriptional regulator with XRE-family HTH domain